VQRPFLTNAVASHETGLASLPGSIVQPQIAAFAVAPASGRSTLLLSKKLGETTQDVGPAATGESPFDRTGSFDLCWPLDHTALKRSADRRIELIHNLGESSETTKKLTFRQRRVREGKLDLGPNLAVVFIVFELNEFGLPAHDEKRLQCNRFVGGLRAIINSGAEYLEVLPVFRREYDDADYILSLRINIP
jgi:hypothetical protein